jgi:3-methyl-2-oxobutanoate hydroxymethyltransferase
MKNGRITTTSLRAMKGHGKRITMVTAYDATFARLISHAEIDVMLIGDSLGMVIQGHDSTLPVEVDEVIYHCRAVVRGRGNGRAHIVADLPFMSYQASTEDALRNAGRLLKEGGAESVKLEGGVAVEDTVQRLTAAGIPVMGHLGLTPQSVHQLGGWRVQGKNQADADRLVRDAQALQAAGAYALVLETVPADLARRVTEILDIPTIGIGAGVDTDGQVLVIYDLLGMSPNFKPKFLKQYANVGETVIEACTTFAEEVRSGSYPSPEYSY